MSEPETAAEVYAPISPGSSAVHDSPQPDDPPAPVPLVVDMPPVPVLVPVLVVVPLVVWWLVSPLPQLQPAHDDASAIAATLPATERAALRARSSRAPTPAIAMPSTHSPRAGAVSPPATTQPQPAPAALSPRPRMSDCCAVPTLPSASLASTTMLAAPPVWMAPSREAWIQLDQGWPSSRC